ncbi:NUDIX domain-containing protein [Candidatus Woesearchaeota archaeon]|jgi:8-oxo-dGTP pyrophosphatase MutT (NUDIX family)|nr:NUDIX domain-containing protein [Candidatus Woesearchaeota archaeon]MBT4321569.1 NUDIX domain-containing protein [Candidatus Woesearchaeota archaeon]MBT4631120.1 NUDIX domain-containing protein [Candidatus Woesearchaeota archaeon]
MILADPEKIDKITVGCVLVFEGKIILFHRTLDNFWNSVAGNMDDDENSDQAIKRELKEEIGLDIKPEFFTTTYHAYDGKVIKYNLFWHEFDSNPSDHIKLSSEHDKFDFFNLEDALKLNLFEDEDYCLKLFYEAFLKDEKL